jgi:hypothetical protein
MRLPDHPAEAVRETLERATQDPDPEVRWSANYSLTQHSYNPQPARPDD